MKNILTNRWIAEALRLKLIGGTLKFDIPHWDNNGLIIGDPKSNPKKIMVALEPNKKTIKQAITEEIDLLITHHPPFIGSLKKIDDNKIMDLIKNNISLISYHILLDKSYKLNRFLNDRFKTEGMNHVFYSSNHCYVGGNFDFPKNIKTTDHIYYWIRDFINSTITTVDIDTLNLLEHKGRNSLVDDKDKDIIFTWGSPSIETLNIIKDKEPGLLITGELNYHNRLDLLENGISIMEIGHDISEDFVREFLIEQVSNIQDEYDLDISVQGDFILDRSF